MGLNKFRQNHHGLFLGTIFLVSAILFSVTFIPPIFLVSFQKTLTDLIPYKDTGVEFEKISFLLDSTIYLIATVTFIWILFSNKFDKENKEQSLLLFFIIHFVFASGAICWGQQYFKYKDFVGGEGQDIFALHVAIIEAGLLFPIIGHLYDKKINKKSAGNIV